MSKLIFIIILVSISASVWSQTIEPKKNKGLYGFTIGKSMLIDFQYDSIEKKYGGYYYARKEGKWGMVTPHGKEVIPCIYDVLYGQPRDLNIGSQNGYKGVLDSTGTILFDFIYDDIDHIEGKKALVKYKSQWCWLEGGIYNCKEEDLIFHYPDTLPRFPGCEEVYNTYEESKECANNRMYSFISNNLNYPALARKKGIKGTVIVKFVVNPTGTIQNTEVVRSIGGGCDEECLAMMAKMPQWIPARHEGKDVAALFVLPIKFVLQ